MNENRSGLSGVLVSNGEDVVRTDSTGTYSLEAVPGVHSFVLLTVPNGHRATGSFYRALPEASSDIGFELETAPHRANTDFTMAQITDTHVRAEPFYRPQGAWLGPETGPTLTRDLRQLEREALPDFIVSTGDLTDWGTTAELRLFRDSIAPVRTPTYPVYGGHDGTEELNSQGGERGFAHVDGTSCVLNYQSILGPVYYSFDWGSRHFVVFSKEDSYFTLDDVERKERWLLNDLKHQPDRRETTLFMHTPPSTEFLDQLSRYNVTLMLYGHTHCGKVFTHGGITAAAPTPLCFGGYDTGPRGYVSVRFTEGGFEFEVSPQSSRPRGTTRPDRIPFGAVGGALSLRWQRALPGPTHRAELVSHRDDLLASVTDDSTRGRSGVYGIDADTGDDRWSIVTDSSVKNSVALDSSGLGAAVSIAGQLYGFQASSGEVVWRQKLPKHPDRWIYASPVLADGVVYAGARSGYGAYDLETGGRLWYSPLTVDLNFGDLVGDGRGSYPSPHVYGDLLILLQNGYALVALDRHDGSIAWEQPLEVTHYYATPALADNLIVSGGSYGHLAVLKVETGEIVWHKPVLDAQYPTNITIEGKRLYVSTNQGSVRCLDLESGRVHWDFQSGEDLLDMNPFRRGVRTVLARPVRYMGMLVVCGVDGGLHLLDADTGSVIGRTQFPAPITAAPADLDDGLCLATWDGRLYRFDDPHR